MKPNKTKEEFNLEDIKKDLERINNILYRFLDKVEFNEKLLWKVETKVKELELVKIWKSRLNKFYKVKHYTKDTYEYVNLKELSKGRMVFFNLYPEDKYKSKSEFNIIIDDYCENWEEISEEDFNLIGKDLKELL